MKRLGLYSGHVYSDKEDYSGECCKILTEEQAGDEKWLEDQRLVNAFKCALSNCGGCPVSRGLMHYDD